jgi:ABC-2 type transport system permease protein
MFRKIWYVAAKDLAQLRKDRFGMIWLIALPLLLMGVLGTLLSGVSSNSASVTATLPIINYDNGALSTALITALQSVPSLKVQIQIDEAAMRTAVRNGDQVGLLIIPAGFTTALESAHPSAQVTYYAVAGNSDQRATIASYTVQAVVQRFAWSTVTSDAIAQAQAQSNGKVNPVLTSQLTTQANQQLDQAPPVSIQSINATGRQYHAQDQTVPGYALMFALFGVMAGAGSLLEEQESGTLKRLLIAPLPPFALLGGKMLSIFIQSLVQLTLLFVAGALLFKIDLGSSPLALALLVVATSLAATCLSMILVSFVRSQRQLRPITTLVVLSFSAIGGSWLPLFLEPQWLQNVAKITINAWAMQGFNDLMIFDQSFSQVLPSIGVLFAYGIVCFIIAARLFRMRFRPA